MRKYLDGDESQMKGATFKGQGRSVYGLVTVIGFPYSKIPFSLRTLLLFRPLEAAHLTYLAFGALWLASPKVRVEISLF